MTDRHAKFSPSSAHRWVNCRESIVLEALAPGSKPSPHAEEGTRAHALAEYCLRHRIHPYEFRDRKFKGEKVTDKIIRGVSKYYDYVERKTRFRSKLAVEKKVKLAKDLWGTVDCSFRRGRVLYVVDYKNGYVEVSPKKNLQLIIYGLGVLEKIDDSDVDRVKLVIVQPNSEGEAVREWQITKRKLLKYRRKLIEISKSQIKGLASGSWCRWCKGAVFCPERINTVEGFKNTNIDKVEIYQLRDIYLQKAAIVDLLDQIEKRFAYFFEHGKKVPGLKMVKKRAYTRWKYDADKLESLCVKKGIDVDAISSVRRDFKTPKQAQKTIGHKLYEKWSTSKSSGNKVVSSEEYGEEVNPLVAEMMED